MPEPKRQKLYVVRHEHGYIKIGISTKPKRRLQDLRNGSPYRLDMIWSKGWGYHADKIERRLHAHFKEDRVRGEWFSITLSDLESAFDKICHDTKDHGFSADELRNQELVRLHQEYDDWKSEDNHAAEWADMCDRLIELEEKFGVAP